MHQQLNIPQPPEHWIPGSIAVGLIAAILAIGVAIGEARGVDEPMSRPAVTAPSAANPTTSNATTSDPTTAGASLSGTPAGPAVVVDSQLPMGYVRRESGDWEAVRPGADNAIGGGASGA